MGFSCSLDLIATNSVSLISMIAPFLAGTIGTLLYINKVNDDKKKAFAKLNYELKEYAVDTNTKDIYKDKESIESKINALTKTISELKIEEVKINSINHNAKEEIENLEFTCGEPKCKTVTNALNTDGISFGEESVKKLIKKKNNNL